MGSLVEHEQKSGTHKEMESRGAAWTETQVPMARPGTVAILGQLSSKACTSITQYCIVTVVLIFAGRDF